MEILRLDGRFKASECLEQIQYGNFTAAKEMLLRGCRTRPIILARRCAAQH